MKYFDIEELAELQETLEAQRNAAFRSLERRRLLMAATDSLFAYQEAQLREAIREYQETASQLKLVREISARVAAADKRLANWQAANDRKSIAAVAAALLAFLER